MAFVVQNDDGTTSGANSYASVAEWTTYFTDRNNTTALAYTDAEVQGALIYATSWLDNNISWYSTIKTATQTTDWPRIDFFDSEGRLITGIPQVLKDATCELALQHLSEALNSTESEGIVSESYGDASITYTSGYSSKSYSFTKVMLKDLGASGASSVNILFRA